MTSDTTAPQTTHLDTGPTVVARAWPTGRPIYAYTVQELADGVDLYTRALKARRRGGGRYA